VGERAVRQQETSDWGGLVVQLVVEVVLGVEDVVIRWLDLLELNNSSFSFMSKLTLRNREPEPYFKY
jgi:hypothetical protein